ncbi:hypothetical protein ACJW30_05G031800 [Castanea mollissima]
MKGDDDSFDIVVTRRPQPKFLTYKQSQKIVTKSKNLKLESNNERSSKTLQYQQTRTGATWQQQKPNVSNLSMAAAAYHILSKKNRRSSTPPSFLDSGYFVCGSLLLT